MSKAKQQNVSGGSGSSAGFATGFLIGQLTLALILFFFIKFFIFGEAPSADERAASRASARRQRTLSHTQAQARQRTLSSALRPRPSSAVLKPRSESGPSVQKLLEKTYYNVHGHQPESLDWFNVLIAQTVAQLRSDAQEDEAVLTSLTALLNGSSKPDFLDEIRVTEISLGDEFPIFSNCRVIPVDENGMPIKQLSGNRGETLQARMDVDLGDVLTLGIETKLVLNYPKPFVAVLPVALAVSVVRFSGTLSVSFSPSSQPSQFPTTEEATPDGAGGEVKNEGHPLNPTGSSPTTLTFTFLDDYRLDLSVHSLIGSRSRLQDVPKIAQLVEARIHQWFDDRCVEPRFQQIVLPSLWPRKRNTRGGSTEDQSATADDMPSPTEVAVSDAPAEAPSSRKEGPGEGPGPTASANGSKAGSETTAEQRTRDWAAKHGKSKGDTSEIEIAGAEMREADEREKKQKLQRQTSGVRLRAGLGRTAKGSERVGGSSLRSEQVRSPS
ncbi:ERMES complex subunit mmm1 [Recurvomyces mirabilis]|uniref:Maintenance of mitochondrial morphology protein 1 n=1 Tax=Recurvomyces mirabilis TaxID=574656 RepID=A0AAE1C3F4_9PEZI|nr:ERMES complex subunit mmm1 [Recurvomyces mirabilis]KAK5154722.1 ERMES complex subunit mmm1 [Recurvomyces mirabilis]